MKTEKPLITKFADAWKEGHTKHDWFHCAKRYAVVKAIQMDKEFVVQTLNGSVEGTEGDYVVEGVKGEVYPCKRDVFEQTYRKTAAGELPHEDMLEIVADYQELVAWLHAHDEEIGVPGKLREDLHDMIYRRLEP